MNGLSLKAGRMARRYPPGEDLSYVARCWCGGSKRACPPGALWALWACFPAGTPAVPYGEEPGCTEVLCLCGDRTQLASIPHAGVQIGLDSKYSITHSSHESADMSTSYVIVVVSRI